MYFNVVRRVCSIPRTVSNILSETIETKNVTINGWIIKSRKTGQYNFLHLHDGLSNDVIQVVVPKDVCSSTPTGSALEVTGTWMKSSGSEQSMELLADECSVLNTDADPRYSSLTPDQLRKSIHLRARSSAYASFLRLRSRILMETHKFYTDRDFFHVDTPVFTANDCEGAGETFSIRTGSGTDQSFFGKNEVFLSVSGQLHLEAIASGISRVYTINSGLRAEKQQSSSHLSEFRMLEVEQAFCSNINDICALAEDYVKHCAKVVISDPLFLKDKSELSLYSLPDHDIIVRDIAEKEFPRLTYQEAIDVLEKNKQKRDSTGLSKSNELFLVNYCKSPLFVTHFPTNQKPFYMKRSNNDATTESFDLLCPLVGELAGGSVREPSLTELKARGVDIPWYLDLRKRGKPISSGYGIGFERLLQVLYGVPNIKDAIPFPRWYKHCQC